MYPIMKRSELFFDAISLPLDFVALLVAAAAAYYLRLSPYVQRVRPAVFRLDLPFVDYMQLAAVVGAVIIIMFALQGLYAMRVTRRLLDEVTRIFSGISLGFVLIIIYIFLSAGFFQSRFILLAAYTFSIALVTIGRFAVRRLQVELLKKGYGIHRVVLVGNGRLGQQLAATFGQQPRFGYQVVAMPQTFMASELEHIYQQNGIDEVIQTDPSAPEEDIIGLLDFCEKYKIDFKYVPNLFETYAPHVRFRQIGSVPVMELLRTPLDGWGRIVKRILDLVGSFVGIVILSPFLVIIAVLVSLDSPGSIFYGQTRIGRYTQPFTLYKFRSMKKEYCLGDQYGGKTAEQFDQQLRASNNERSGPLFKMKNDPRITQIGRILRKSRIDELPQLWNVLRGEMSLIGPRPHLPQEVAKYTKYHRKLFTIKPGMSGMAQVHGNAGLPFEQEAKLDIGYIENWSLWLDLILLLKTFYILLTDKNAV